VSENESKVFIVDDDEAMCDALRCFLESQHLAVETYTSGETFLAAYRPDHRGCLVLDVRMAGLGGLELQKRLATDPLHLPVIILTGHGDIAMAVRAMRNGAYDFLEKPVSDRVLLDRVRQALHLDDQQHKAHAASSAAVTRLNDLTPRQREVMNHVLGGKPNKQIAGELSISEKTVEVHRKRVMTKMGVHSAVELLRVVMQIDPQHRTALNLDGDIPAPTDPAPSSPSTDA
jgi:two-component system, LuxR family, response regulator FixJ